MLEIKFKPENNKNPGKFMPIIINVILNAQFRKKLYLCALN